jgi:Holliday junction DNA helicase RuvA
MISRLEGVLAHKQPDQVVLDVNGVGYEVRIPLTTFLGLPDAGKTVALRIHTYVREDAFQLYGFEADTERELFRLLLGISGVGPRVALAILSGLPVDRLLMAIRDADVRSLTGIPGVGKKTAERILIDLRDKVARFEPLGSAPGHADDVGEAVVSALLNLGYPQAHAERAAHEALAELGAGAGLESAIKEALRVAAG